MMWILNVLLFRWIAQTTSGMFKLEKCFSVDRFHCYRLFTTVWKVTFLTKYSCWQELPEQITQRSGSNSKKRSHVCSLEVWNVFVFIILFYLFVFIFNFTYLSSVLERKVAGVKFFVCVIPLKLILISALKCQTRTEQHIFYQALLRVTSRGECWALFDRYTWSMAAKPGKNQK